MRPVPSSNSTSIHQQTTNSRALIATAPPQNLSWHPGNPQPSRWSLAACSSIIAPHPIISFARPKDSFFLPSPTTSHPPPVLIAQDAGFLPAPAMWRFNPFTQKEPSGLEGRSLDVGGVRVHVRSPIAEGGFSCVYLCRDAAHPSSKQYALKHMICVDGESLDLAMKEISVMKLLRGHPNVVALVAHAVLDTGRTKEVMVVMEFCEKSLVGMLEDRGGGYFEEKRALLIFRDVCNAVRALHSQSPPIAHRDLKVENVLLGSDGAWKLCDFGSTSINHKCFDKPEEMGLEEDNIRKHTTPAYRAPEMWDLFRKEVINEKVDIWALGCLLYRICYLKSAFDGESKLQILNGNYKIPELPKYSTCVTSLIKDMLKASPDARPDIMQILSCVNEQLPVEFRKHLPDGSAINHNPTAALFDEGTTKRAPSMPRRNPPPPPSAREQARNSAGKTDTESSRPSQATSKSTVDGAPIGAFWSTQHAQGSQIIEDKCPLFDKPQTTQTSSVRNQNSIGCKPNSPSEYQSGPGYSHRQNANGHSSKKFDDGPTKNNERKPFPDNPTTRSDKMRASLPESKATFQNEAFNAFVAEFDTTKFNSGNTHSSVNSSKSRKEEVEAEVDRLKEQLKQANLEKAEITFKYDKLSAICRSQRQELQELKRALAKTTDKDSSRSQIPDGSSQSCALQREKIEGGLWELQQGMFANSSASPNPEPKVWHAFSEEPKEQTVPRRNSVGSIWTTGNHQFSTTLSATGTASNLWAFHQDSSGSVPIGPQVSRTCIQGDMSQIFSGGAQIKKVETTQPAGWAGF